MHQLTGTRQKTKGNPPSGKRKLTYPPANGITFEQQQLSRENLITNKRIKQSVNVTREGCKMNKKMQVIVFLLITGACMSIVLALLFGF